MSKASASAKALDRLVVDSLAPPLRAREFKRDARSFFHAAGDLFHCIWIQASRWNSPLEASFTANLRVVWPRWHEVYTGQPVGQNPTLAASVVEVRASTLLTGTDHWWRLDHETDTAALGLEVANCVCSAADAFFPLFSSSLDVLARLDSGEPGYGLISGSLAHAVLLADNGRLPQAKALVAELSSKPPRWVAIGLVAERMGLGSAT